VAGELEFRGYWGLEFRASLAQQALLTSELLHQPLNISFDTGIVSKKRRAVISVKLKNWLLWSCF
jgi:hypothetical protein